jgi:hypothetical protein
MNSASQRGPFAEETLGAGRARVSRQTIAEAPEIRVGSLGPRAAADKPPARRFVGLRKRVFEANGPR